MKSASTWRLVMKIVGLSLVLAGLVCLVIGFWDKLAVDAAAVADKLSGKHSPEFDDYDDEQLCA